jgi:hypothetical protein
VNAENMECDGKEESEVVEVRGGRFEPDVALARALS